MTLKNAERVRQCKYKLETVLAELRQVQDEEIGGEMMPYLGDAINEIEEAIGDIDMSLIGD